MMVLVLGLLAFLGAHSVRLFADDWRGRQMARIGANAWKGIYALVSLAGLLAIIWGYGLARATPIALWTPPLWTYHLTIALTLPAFILLVAAYVPGNHFKSWLGHPMLAGTKLWALAHLLCNGTLADVLLFGSFLIWSVAAFANSRRRDRRNGVGYRRGTLGATALTLIVGTLTWGVFAHWLHVWLIGVNPLAWMAAH